MRKVIVLLILGLGLWQTGALAKQSKYYNGQELLSFNIASRELTHIAIENDRITGLKMSNDSLEAEQNDKSGDLFVRVKSETLDPITLFLTTEQGRTIGLKLTPKNIGADSILIKIKEETSVGNELISGTSTSREQQIINILKMLEAGIEVEAITRTPKTINNLKVESATQYSSEALQGQRFVLKNTSKKDVTLEEPIFGGAKVVAVALSKLQIEPNGNVDLFLVKELD